MKTSRNRKVVGVIDDNPHKKGKLIHGVRILGGRECILDVAKKYEVDEIILAIPSASPKEQETSFASVIRQLVS